jgi:hypothetical protein
MDTRERRKLGCLQPARHLGPAQDGPAVEELDHLRLDRRGLVVRQRDGGDDGVAVQADRLETLRRAFDATVRDPEFLADAAKTRFTVGSITGEELQKLVGEVTSLSPALLD